jgi:hypothetical protein
MGGADLEDERNRRRMAPAAGSITPASAKALQFSRRGTARKLSRRSMTAVFGKTGALDHAGLRQFRTSELLQEETEGREKGGFSFGHFLCSLCYLL